MNDSRLQQATACFEEGRKLVRDVMSELPESVDRAFLGHANDLASRAIECVGSAAK